MDEKKEEEAKSSVLGFFGDAVMMEQPIDMPHTSPQYTVWLVPNDNNYGYYIQIEHLGIIHGEPGQHIAEIDMNNFLGGLSVNDANKNFSTWDHVYQERATTLRDGLIQQLEAELEARLDERKAAPSQLK